jgi:hypothetical protein
MAFVDTPVSKIFSGQPRSRLRSLVKLRCEIAERTRIHHCSSADEEKHQRGKNMKSTTFTKLAISTAILALMAGTASAQVIGGKPKVGESTAGVPAETAATSATLPVTEPAAQSQNNGEKSKASTAASKKGMSDKKAKASKAKMENAAEDESGAGAKAKHSKHSDEAATEGKSGKKAEEQTPSEPSND